MSHAVNRITTEIKRPRHDISASVACGTLPAMRSTGTQTFTRVAVYEEDDLMRALLTEWLRDAGYRVQGVEPHSVQPPAEVDLVIASLYMPKHTGAKVVQEIQAAHPGIPVIALSGQFRCGLSSAGLTAQTLGAAQVIAKPLTRDALLGAVRAMIGPAN
jgi:DNA-binding response OmpR family regulator